MKRAGFFDLMEEQQKQNFVVRVNKSGKPLNWSAGDIIARLVLLLVAAILCRAPEADAATTPAPSVSASTPSAGVAASPTPSAAEWLTEAERHLDAKDFAKALALF